jgi:hypothetical protein
MTRRAALVAASLALATCWLMPGVIRGNMAPTVMPGHAVGEPAGELADVHIEREQLNFDLRPLADGDAVTVEATYQVRNDGAPRQLDLVFVAAGLVDGDGGVWLDGAPVDYTTERLTPSAEPPPGIPWRPPQTTPQLAGGTVGYSAQYEGLLRFSLELGAGAHEIRVRYPAEATAYTGASPARFWQLGYSLAPARQWASFGTLDVVVQLPPGWHFAASPELTRQGDEARGSFAGIPADAIGMTMQFPVSDPDPISWLLIGVASVTGLALAALVGYLFGRAGRRPSSAWPINLLYALVASFVAIFLRGTIMRDETSVPASQAAWGYFPGIGDAIGDAFTAIAGFVVMLPVLFLAMQVVATLIGRRAAGRRPLETAG